MKWFLLLLLLAPLTELSAQEAVQAIPGTLVKVGARVRVLRAWPYDYWAEGSVVALDADTLVLLEKIYKTTAAIPFTSITKLEVRVTATGQWRETVAWREVPVSLTEEVEVTTPGTRVRVTLPSGFYQQYQPREEFISYPLLGGTPRLVGSIVELNADTLLLRGEGRASPVAIPLASVTKWEVSRGQASRKDILTTAGMMSLSGALAGGGVGGFFGLLGWVGHWVGYVYSTLSQARVF